MSEEWHKTTLGEAADVFMGQSPPGRTYNTSGVGLPFLQGSAEFGTQTPSPVKWCSQPTRIAETGDLLVSVRAPVGDTNFADQRIAYGRGLAVVRGRDGTLTEFLRLVIQQGTADLLSRSGGGMFSSITAANLRGYEIALPSVPVQRRIVDLMEHLDTHLANLETELATFDQSLKALRRWTFTSLSGATVRAADKFDMLLGRQKSARQSIGEFVIPYLRAANVTDAGLNLADVQSMNFEPHEQAKYCLLKDDIVLVEGGTIGLAARWQGEIQGPVGFDKHVIRLRAKEGVSTSEYALQWCKWSRDSAAFDDQATGITIRALGFGRASNMQVPDIGIDQQIGLMAPIREAERAATALRAEQSSLRALRTQVLATLLARTMEIPASYDRFLGMAS